MKRLIRDSVFVRWMGASPSNGDISVSLCLLVRFGRAVIFTFPLVSCLGCLGDIVIRAIRGLMILLTVHGVTRGAYVPIQRGGILVERWRKRCARQVAEMPRPSKTTHRTLWCVDMRHRRPPVIIINTHRPPNARSYIELGPSFMQLH